MELIKKKNKNQREKLEKMIICKRQNLTKNYH